MAQGSAKRASAATAVLVLVVVLAAVAALVVAAYSHYKQPETAVAAEHPAVGAQPCNSCKAFGHDYVHGEPYTGACQECHTTSSWLVAHYTHNNADFNSSLHGVIGCAFCHEEGKPAPSPACETCHASRSPHKVGKLACAPCHTVIAWPLLRPLPEDHLSLEGGHAGLGCFECHKGGVDTDVPSPRGCVDCHGEHHGGLRNCEDCHDPARGWSPIPGFDHSAFFKLEGKHAEIECGACHVGGRFAGTPKTCVGCHGTMHGGLTQCEKCHDPARGWKPVPGFDHSAFFKLEGKHAQAQCAECHKKGKFAGTPTACRGCHPVAHKNLTQCEQCHTPRGFVPSTFDHDRHFKITGGHAKLSCIACHPKGIYDGTPTVCTGCHGVAHGGLTACQDCHTTAGFRPSTFNHATRFKLVGAHAKVRCDKCHPGNRYASNIGRGSHECSACHKSPHGSGIAQCDSCHRPTKWSDILLRVHPGEISLGEAHASRSCRLCHPTLKFNDDPPKPCESCHLQDCIHVGPTDCLRCHRPTAWSEVYFTHPDIGVHEGTDLNRWCLKCHPGPDFTVVKCTSCHKFVDSSSGSAKTPWPIRPPEVAPEEPTMQDPVGAGDARPAGVEPTGAEPAEAELSSTTAE